VTIVCTAPNCPKKFLCAQCVITDHTHFAAHTKDILEFSTLLNMINKNCSRAPSGLTEDLDLTNPQNQTLSKLKSQIQETRADFTKTISNSEAHIKAYYQNFKKKFLELWDQSYKTFLDKTKEGPLKIHKKLSAHEQELETILDFHKTKSDKLQKLDEL
jgi:hypothetical protein